MVPLRLFNSLTRSIETFEPVHPGEARVYTCGPTVYNYQHVGNMRAYVFADTLGRILSYKGYALRHVINITDVGHLTSDADEGADKMETAAARAGKSAWDIAKFYADAYWRDIDRLNIRQPATWSIATDYVPAMIEFAKSIEANCYQLPSGLYFDTTTVPEYGRLARTKTDEGESRIDTVEGKRHPTDFAIWRATPPGETRQMEWDSPWGRGAPGWHLECSVMSEALLGFPFDIHTGGIDHREIHHPNEIAQNQARCHSADSGARIWMHNNFLIDRGGKMSKSKGEFLTLQALVDRGFHPLAYRLMCLQAHYRSELEFTFENLAAALTRLKRMVIAAEKLPAAETSEVTDKRVTAELAAFDEAVSDDLNTAKALTHFETVLTTKGLDAGQRRAALAQMDSVLGLTVLGLSRAELRVPPKDASIDETAIEARLAERKDARAAKDFATSDRIRDELAAEGVEVMDGDPLGWDWSIPLP
ncbi:cysteine--tRNA ligase [Sphingomonas changbaiensis NBRC 104936]|uniref:Cysteine--tRNA ligase n=1 Tax=Sphingomonas changbaiensis NBRC 104936 TaxID=1219043 RepID=A0A0E9MKS5_9SPHN|nr:cysteine--tRNA ligase [Sphingomonas changbaiensis]GAO38016.1 cysteine--tRNA ligase [Sphingomonas changbaiensis NBRC 104936]